MNPTTRPTTNPTRRPTTPRPARPAGWIYLLHTTNDPTKYVGQTSVPVPQRVRQHRRPLEQGGQRWGHEILPGREGYTILARVESFGDPFLDAIALDLVEAEMIQKWTPSENTNRPNPQVFRDRLAAAQRTTGAGRPNAPRGPNPTTPRWVGGLGPMDIHGNPTTHPTTRPTANPTHRPTRHPTTRSNGQRWALVIRLVLGVVLGVVAARATAHTGPPWWPWAFTAATAVLGPFGVIGAFRWAVHKYVEPVMGPPRRRRRRRP